MTEAQSTFQNAEGIRIAYRAWRTTRDVRGAVVIAHGLGEHSGRYRHVAAALTEAGFAVYGIDHRGHGNSGGTRAYVPDMRLAAEDLRQLIEIVRLQHAGKPLLLFGHSMGSLIGLEYELRYSGRLRAMALSGCAIHAETTRPAWLTGLCLRAARYVPKLRLSPPISPKALTHDSELLQAWWDDPLVDKGMWRVGTSAAIIESGRRIRSALPELRLPILALHGEDDHLVPASGSRYLARHAGSADMTLRVYPELRHELVNESGSEAIIGVIVEWMLARLQSAQDIAEDRKSQSHKDAKN